jgi:hypothetical protein
MAISKDFLWGTIEQLTDELERADPQSLIGARVRGLLDAKQLSLHTTDRHNQPKQSYRSHDDECVRRYLSGKSTWTIAAELGINSTRKSTSVNSLGWWVWLCLLGSGLWWGGRERGAFSTA